MNTRNIEALSVEDFILRISRKNKLHQAIALQSVEDIFSDEMASWIKKNPTATDNQIEKHREENNLKYRELRKIFLDWSNEYTRSIMKTIFGDEFEGNLK